jgi:hypothetical protein
MTRTQAGWRSKYYVFVNTKFRFSPTSVIVDTHPKHFYILRVKYGSRDSSVGISTPLRAGRSGDRNRVEVVFSVPSRPAPRQAVRIGCLYPPPPPENIFE